MDVRKETTRRNREEVVDQGVLRAMIGGAEIAPDPVSLGIFHVKFRELEDAKKFTSELYTRGFASLLPGYSEQKRKIHVLKGIEGQDIFIVKMTQVEFDAINLPVDRHNQLSSIVMEMHEEVVRDVVSTRDVQPIENPQTYTNEELLNRLGMTWDTHQLALDCRASGFGQFDNQDWALFEQLLDRIKNQIRIINFSDSDIGFLDTTRGALAGFITILEKLISSDKLSQVDLSSNALSELPLTSMKKLCDCLFGLCQQSVRVALDGNNLQEKHWRLFMVAIFSNQRNIVQRLSSDKINTAHWYRDDDIDCCVSAELTSHHWQFQNDCTFLLEGPLEGKFANEAHDQQPCYVVLTPAVDTCGITLPVDYYLDYCSPQSGTLAQYLQTLITYPNIDLNMLKFLNNLELRGFLKEYIIDDDEIVRKIMEILDSCQFSDAHIIQKIHQIQRPQRKDVFDELMPFLRREDDVFGRVLFPFNSDDTQSHWLLGEIVIHKSHDHYEVNLFAHDPRGHDAMDESVYHKVEAAVERRIRQLHTGGDPVITCTCQLSLYHPRQAKGDFVSNGVIVVDDLIRRIEGRSLSRQTYDKGVMALRCAHILKVSAARNEMDTIKVLGFFSRAFEHHLLNTERLALNNVIWLRKGELYTYKNEFREIDLINRVVSSGDNKFIPSDEIEYINAGDERCGKFGEILLGKWFGADVAVKRVGRFNTLNEKVYKERKLRQEIQLLLNFQHPRIVSVYGYIKDQNSWLLVMEFLWRPTLTEYLHGKISEAWHLPMSWRLCSALEIAEGLGYLHNRGILHLDLKSDNVMVTNDWHIKLIDFGFSRELCLNTHASSKSADGTPTYLDVAITLNISNDRNARTKYRKANDIYSFSILLWELLYRDNPYHEMFQASIDVIEFLQQVIAGARPDQHDFTCPVLNEVNTLMAECWSERYNNRPTINDVIKRLTTSHQEFNRAHFIEVRECPSNTAIISRIGVFTAQNREVGDSDSVEDTDRVNHSNI